MACDIVDQSPEPLTVKDLKWVESSEMGNYEFVPADAESMDKLLAQP